MFDTIVGVVRNPLTEPDGTEIPKSGRERFTTRQIFFLSGFVSTRLIISTNPIFFFNRF